MTLTYFHMVISIGKGQDVAHFMSEYVSESLNTSDSVGRVLLILVCNISIIFSIQLTIETDKYNIIIRLLSECNYEKADNFYQMNSF